MFLKSITYSDVGNFGPLVVRVGSHVERPENRTLYKDRPLVSVPLSPPVTASTVNISIDNTSTVLQLCEVEVYAVRCELHCLTFPSISEMHYHIYR